MLQAVSSPTWALDLRRLLYPEKPPEDGTEPLKQTRLAQPALFVIEYALARLWMSWGIEPAAMIGHSIGEYVAACLAGVFSLEEALNLVARRGAMMQQLPSGAMLSIQQPGAEVERLLSELRLEKQLSVAAINAPDLCVVSGATESVEKLEAELTKRTVEHRRLHTSHAFHSPMMDQIMEPFVQEVTKLKLKEPARPYLSNLTGTWITKDQATDPNYWGSHLRQGVRFSQGIGELLKDRERVFLEVGPGQSLCTLTKAHLAPGVEPLVFSSLRTVESPLPDQAHLLQALGRLWLSGAKISWTNFYAGEKRRRVPLPTYPFERQRYWIEGHAQTSASQRPPVSKQQNIRDWFYAPFWKQLVPLSSRNLPTQKLRWLIFVHEAAFYLEFLDALKATGQEVLSVGWGNDFSKISERDYSIRPERVRRLWEKLVEELHRLDKIPERIVHLWSTKTQRSTPGGKGFFRRNPGARLL